MHEGTHVEGGELELLELADRAPVGVQHRLELFGRPIGAGRGDEPEGIRRGHLGRIEGRNACWMEPAQRIRTHADLERFPSTSAYAQIVHRLGCLNTAVRSNYEPSSAPATPSILLLLALLDHIHQSILSTPLHTTSQRFGNTAFRAFHAQLLLSLPTLLAPLVPPSLSVHLPEISHHLVNSFGNPTRIDYGTGHELSFLAFLTILHSLELLKVEDDRVVVEKLFGKYLDVVREAQRWFGLEPAGSKGVWGLDDHQHLSYLFGSSQLIGSSSLLFDPH